MAVHLWLFPLWRRLFALLFQQVLLGELRLLLLARCRLGVAAMGLGLGLLSLLLPLSGGRRRTERRNSAASWLRLSVALEMVPRVQVEWRPTQPSLQQLLQRSPVIRLTPPLE